MNLRFNFHLFKFNHLIMYFNVIYNFLFIIFIKKQILNYYNGLLFFNSMLNILLYPFLKKN